MKLTAVIEAENYDQARNWMRARVNTDTPLFLGFEGQRVIEETTLNRIKQHDPCLDRRDAP